MNSPAGMSTFGASLGGRVAGTTVSGGGNGDGMAESVSSFLD